MAKSTAISAEKFIEKKLAELQTLKPIKLKDIGRKGKHYFKIASRTMRVADDLNSKVFVFERLEFERTTGKKSNQAVVPKISYRFGYYIIGKIGTKRNSWTWGQYSPMISARDLKELLAQAKADGTLLCK